MNAIRFPRLRSVARPRWLSAMLLAACAQPLPNACPASEAPAQTSAEAAGTTLAAELRRQPPALNTAGTLRRRDPKGRWLPALPVQFEVRGDDLAWESLYRVFAPTGALMETLVVSHAAGKGNRYTLRRTAVGGEAAGENTFEGNASAVALAGSDFWLCDLGLEFLYWPAQRIVRTEMRKGRSCRVLESLNPEPQAGVYARVLSWVDLESGGLLRAEAFDQNGRRMKEFNIGSLKKLDGRYQLKAMEIRSEPTDTRTRIEFELEVAD